MAVSLTTLAELFIGLAGFSGIVIALSGAGTAPDPLARFRVSVLLFSSLGGAVFAVLPQVLHDAGVGQAGVIVIASAAFGFYFAFWAMWSVRKRLVLPPEARANLHPIMWVFGVGGSAVFTVWLSANAIGWPAPAAMGPYLSGLMFFFVLASLMFVRQLLTQPHQGKSDD